MNRLFSKVVETDWSKWFRNTCIFAAPFLLVFLLSIKDGSDIKDALNVLYLYALNVGIDLLRKFVAANPNE